MSAEQRIGLHGGRERGIREELRASSIGWTRSRPASVRRSLAADVKAEEVCLKAGRGVFLAEENHAVEDRIHERHRLGAAACSNG